MNPADAAYAVLGPSTDWSVYRAAMLRSCPWCRARPGQQCHTLGRRLLLGDRVHPSRRQP